MGAERKKKVIKEVKRERRMEEKDGSVERERGKEGGREIINGHERTCEATCYIPIETDWQRAFA